MQTLQSVKTAFRVFETVADAQPIGLSELARRCRLNKATAQRCLLTLKEIGWLRMEEANSKWVITTRILSLSSGARQDTSITQIALPAMMRLRDSCGENVHLAVPERGEAVLLERLESPQPIRVYYAIGSRVPLNAAATGKAMMAWWPPEQIDAFIASGLRRVTAATITSGERLRAELAEIRRRGWASTVNELDEGASAVAAPIFDASGVPIAAISVSAPTIRMTAEKRLIHAAMVLDTAREISAATGASGERG